ncbi:DUF4279 domain-containing protein [Nostoc sp.]|uniref:DUF4279 domain-containing protein n=1 Tax=Nostoc sp. TaxID=1180 RepID=UPI002FFC9B03
MNADEYIYMESEISASFTLTRFDSDPEEITTILGILPTKTWKIGDVIGKGILRRKQNGWILESQLEKTVDLESHIKDVLARLQPSWEKLVEICPQYYTEISGVIYCYDPKSPAIHFNNEIIKSAFELNTEIDVDYYFLYEYVYSGFHSDEVQHYIARCKGTALPCPYGCTLLGRETLYMESEISAAFTLTGFDSDPEEITKILEILPTETCRVGDVIGKSILRRKQNAWVLKSQLEKTANLENHIKDVLARLKPSWQKLVEICSKYDSEISCVIYSVEAQGEVISFDKEIIKSAFEFNAEIDVDYYCLHKSE